MTSPRRLPLTLAAALCGGVLAGHAMAAVVEVRRPGFSVTPDAAWIERVEDGIARSEYSFAPAEPGVFSAPNRAHDLRVRADRERLTLSRRAHGKDRAGWTFWMRPVRWGREGSPKLLRAVDPRADGARLEYLYDGLAARLDNGEHGIDLVFEVAGPPADAEPGEPLILDLEIAPTLGAFPQADGRGVAFRDAGSNVVLNAIDLGAADASGRALDVRFEVSLGTLRIVVDDAAGAAAPIQIRTSLVGPGWSRYGGQAGAALGVSAVTAGDVNHDGFSDVIVGANRYDNGQTDEGRVYLFLGGATGLSSTPAWSAEGDQAGAQFGGSIAPAGDVNGDGFGDVVIGAPGFDAGEVDEGNVFLYHGGPGGLQAMPARILEINQAAANFGQSVDTAGDVNGDGYADIVAGAPLYDDGEPDEGAVFVFLGSASGIAATPVWQRGANLAGARLGSSVAGAGDCNGDGYADVVAGAPGWASGQSSEGAVFVWAGGPAGPGVTPLQQTESNFSLAQLGVSVAGAGDVNGDGYADILAGAPLYGPALARTGRAFLYLGSPIGPVLPAAWMGAGLTQNARYGQAVAAAGDVNADGYADFVIGSSGYSDFATNQGAAYLYLGSAAGPTTEETLVILGGSQDDRLGTSVGTAGDVDGDGRSEFLVGATGATQAFAGEGSAQLFRAAGSVLTAAPVWTADSNQSSSQFGFALAPAGDVNGDGFTDVVVGCPQCENDLGDEGMAFLYLGGPAGLGATPAWTAEGNQAGAQFGIAVAGAGDVNGDGYADVLVGAWLFDGGQQDEGAAFLYLGGSGGLSAAPAWVGEGDQASASYGFSVAGAGDVNGDSFADILVGAPDMDFAQADEGAAFLYFGSASGPAPAPALPWVTFGGQAGAAHGYSVATAGDMNGDGYSDVVVGAPGYDYGGRIDSGRASVYLGRFEGLRESSIWDLVLWSPGAALGREVATAGDVNGDGFSDIVLGAPFDDYAGADAGTALVLYGSATMYTSPVTFLDGGAGWYLGASVGTAGDVNGDGYSDVIAGAYNFTSVLTPITSQGLAQVYLGSASGVATISSWGPNGGQALGFFGRRVRAAGDVNADGFSDIVVGAPGNANGQSSEGMAYAWYGGGLDGLHVPIVQKRTDGLANVAPLGWSDDDDAIRLQALARNPAGRSRVRIEAEIRSLGVAFNGLDTWLSPWSDTGAAVPVHGSAVTLQEVFGPLASVPSRMQRWRLRMLGASPYFPRSRWYWSWANAPTEGDLWLATCRDTDGDGYGVPGWAGCPMGAAPDCDDRSAAVHPGAVEICDRVDNDCDGHADNVPLPGTTQLDMAGNLLQWALPGGATGADVVRVNLAILRSTGGDFYAATVECLGDNLTSGTLTDTVLPAVGKAWMYIVRGVNCIGGGTWDEGGAQARSRDADINSSPVTCP